MNHKMCNPANFYACPLNFLGTMMAWNSIDVIIFPSEEIEIWLMKNYFVSSLKHVQIEHLGLQE